MASTHNPGGGDGRDTEHGFEIGQRVKFSLNKKVHSGVVRYLGRTKNASKPILGLELSAPMEVLSSRYDGKGGYIRRDGSVMQAFGPTAPGCAVFVGAASVLPDDDTEAHMSHSAKRIQSVYRGKRARTRLEDDYQTTMHMLERAHEKEAIAAAKRRLAFQRDEARAAAAALSKPPPPSPRRAPPLGLGERGITADIPVEPRYPGPHLTFPLTKEQVDTLFEALVARKHLHYKYVLQLLSRFMQTLDQTPAGNCIAVPVPAGTKCILVGDTHGQLEDVLHIFKKYGRPSDTVRYVFNGDIADRGDRAIEIFLILAAHRVLNPSSVHINRGNHEDDSLNEISGFKTEVFTKYAGQEGELVYDRFETMFKALPLCCVVDSKIFMTHGGLSDQKRVTLKSIAQIRRMRAVPVGERSRCTRGENIFMGLMWSDPTNNHKGTHFNNARGCAVTWGVDVTEKFLKLNKLKLLIRSHECVPKGFQVMHNRKCMTLFSASNYCGTSNNRGAVVVLEHGFNPADITSASSPLRYTYNVKSVFSHATLVPSVLRAKGADFRYWVTGCLAVEALVCNKAELWDRFAEIDADNSGLLPVEDVVEILKDTLHSHAQWGNMLRIIGNATYEADKKFFRVSTSGAQLVDYAKLLNRFRVTMPSGFEESLRGIVSRRLIELFRATSPDKGRPSSRAVHAVFDLNEDGRVTYGEFVHACDALGISKLYPEGQIFDLAMAMDTDNSGDLSLDDIHESFKIFVPTSPPGVDRDWVQGQLKRIARHIYMHHASLDMAFHAADLNRNMFVSFSEFNGFMHRVGMSISEEEARRVFDCLDHNADGRLSLHEFSRGFRIEFRPGHSHHSKPLPEAPVAHGRGLAPPLPPAGSSSGAGAGAGAGAGRGGRSRAGSVSATGPARQPQHEQWVSRLLQMVATDVHRFRTTIRSTFMYLSASASQRRGFVNKSQFFTAIRRIGLGARSPLQHMSRDDTDLIFEAVDTNGDGMVDADEFLNAFSIKGVDGDYFGDRRSLHTN